MGNTTTNRKPSKKSLEALFALYEQAEQDYNQMDAAGFAPEQIEANIRERARIILSGGDISAEDQVSIQEQANPFGTEDDPFNVLDSVEGQEVVPMGVKFVQFKEPGETFTGIFQGDSDDYDGLVFKPFPDNKDGRDYILSRLFAIEKAIRDTFDGAHAASFPKDRTVFRFTFLEEREMRKKAGKVKEFKVERRVIPATNG